MTTTESPAAGTDKEKRKNEVIQYRKDLQADINTHRAEQFEKTEELEGMGGEDQYDDGILEIVKRKGEKGVTAADLHKVFADADKLSKARVRLANNKLITSDKAGMTHLLKAVGSPTTEVPAPAVA